MVTHPGDPPVLLDRVRVEAGEYHLVCAPLKLAGASPARAVLIRDWRRIGQACGGR